MRYFTPSTSLNWPARMAQTARRTKPAAKASPTAVKAMINAQWVGSMTVPFQYQLFATRNRSNFQARRAGTASIRMKMMRQRARIQLSLRIWRTLMGPSSASSSCGTEWFWSSSLMGSPQASVLGFRDHAEQAHEGQHATEKDEEHEVPQHDHVAADLGLGFLCGSGHRPSSLVLAADGGDGILEALEGLQERGLVLHGEEEHAHFALVGRLAELGVALAFEAGADHEVARAVVAVADGAAAHEGGVGALGEGHLHLGGLDHPRAGQDHDLDLGVVQERLVLVDHVLDGDGALADEADDDLVLLLNGVGHLRLPGPGGPSHRPRSSWSGC